MLTRFVPRTRRARAAVALAFVVAVSAALIPTAGAKESTRRLRGDFRTTTFSGPGCSSPIDLCAKGTVRGTLNGPIVAVATSLIPTSQPGIVFGVADVVIHDVRGDLSCTESFIVNATPGSDGEEGVVCRFTGGTGAWAGVSGYFAGYGFAPPGQDTSGVFEGKLTIP